MTPPVDISAADAAFDRPAPAPRRASRGMEIDAADIAHCREAIRHGSLSFHAASRLLPADVRDPALALYAFCRLADDAVDLQEEKVAAVLRLKERLDLVYAGRPRNAPTDRAFTAMVEAVDMPRALPEALLEGLAWDAMGRRYRTMEDLHAYSARVASAVGVMMAVIMGVRDGHALARACDLGVAMQLTNIARDVGEDARAHRIYLPLDWLDAARIDPENFLYDPAPTDEIRGMVRRLLAEARRLYIRGADGVVSLPVACRPGILAARHIYAGIGADIARAGHDSVSRRAHTTAGQKLGCLALSTFQALGAGMMPRAATYYAAPLPACRFLVEAAARPATAAGPWGEGRAGDLVALFADLKARDARRRAQLRPPPPAPVGAERMAAE
jgi:phytoene synthase